MGFGLDYDSGRCRGFQEGLFGGGAERRVARGRGARERRPGIKHDESDAEQEDKFVDVRQAFGVEVRGTKVACGGERLVIGMVMVMMVMCRRRHRRAGVVCNGVGSIGRPLTMHAFSF